MKAMILAAGLGTRLRPLTSTIPKALVPVGGTPILEHLIARLKKSGITEIIINIHHFAEQISNFLISKHYFDIRIEISHEPELLDTGGGLKKARWFFDDGMPFLVHNVDVLSNLDLDHFRQYHESRNGLATLAVRFRKTSRYFLFDSNDRLLGWEDLLSGQRRIVHSNADTAQSLAFMGIHIISPEIFTRLPLPEKFSIVGAYLDLAEKNESIYAFHADAYNWLDLGQPQNLSAAEDFIHHSSSV